jgi:hypothetical protein
LKRRRVRSSGWPRRGMRCRGRFELPIRRKRFIAPRCGVYCGTRAKESRGKDHPNPESRSRWRRRRKC